jgi:hypothetical protein
VERQITRQVDNSAEVQGVVSSLEKRYDEHSDGSRRSLLVKQNMELATAEELGAAVEAYLAGPRAADELAGTLSDAAQDSAAEPGSTPSGPDSDDDGSQKGTDDGGERTGD